MLGAKNPEREYVAARRVLLDVLEAIGVHRKAVVLVGAQAIYLHVGGGDLSVAPFTTDGDLAIVPDDLDEEPDLVETLHSAGFQLAVNPGTWTRNDVQIDFLVPSQLGGAGRRAARLGVHGTEVARKASGLEAAVVDRARFTITALEDDDGRTFDISVAGISALLSERGQPRRWVRTTELAAICRMPLRRSGQTRHGRASSVIGSGPPTPPGAPISPASSTGSARCTGSRRR
jgi:hypothetical protein